MRDINDFKFRGYDTEYEKMTYFDDEEYDYRPPLAFRLDQVFKKDINYNDYEDFEYKDITDKLEIMQYTGLHDKNGKEIYEGDIVGDKDIKWVIKWNLHRMGFSLYPTNEQLYDEMPINVENKLGFEILGNIYDNPDLLEKGAKE